MSVFFDFADGCHYDYPAASTKTPVNMNETARSLEDLRREIDAIDDAIHDLVMRRTALLTDVASVKGLAKGAAAGAFLRPGREAVVLRRLIARHRGRFPKPALVHLWREIISAPFSLQGAFSAAVYAPKDQPGYWDLARDHYGTGAPFAAYTAPSQVIGALVDGAAVVGVLPVIEDDDPDPWWPLLAREDKRIPYVMARLPFAPSRNARGERLEAFVVGPVSPEPTGRDHSYLAFEASEELSRARLSTQLKKAELEPCFFAARAEADGRHLVLVGVGDYVARDDARLERFASAMAESIRRVFHLGGYALPFEPRELAPPKATR
jgi:chorismate mutase-like protein